MDAVDIRRENINLLAEVIGRSRIAEKMGYEDTNYLNQLCAGHGSFGGRTARKVEAALQLARGWMDIRHSAEEYLLLRAAIRGEPIAFVPPHQTMVVGTPAAEQDRADTGPGNVASPMLRSPAGQQLAARLQEVERTGHLSPPVVEAIERVLDLARPAPSRYQRLKGRVHASQDPVE